MPILATGKCSLFCNMVCCFYFLIFGLVFIGIAGSITEVNIKQYNYYIRLDLITVLNVKDNNNV